MKTQDNMKTWHTPGPWKTETVGNCTTRSGRDIIVEADGHLVATLEDLSAASHANARLIAAAPELVETVRYVEAMAESIRAHRPGDTLATRIDFIIKQTKAVLAKVKGA